MARPIQFYEHDGLIGAEGELTFYDGDDFAGAEGHGHEVRVGIFGFVWWHNAEMQVVVEVFALRWSEFAEVGFDVCKKAIFVFVDGDGGGGVAREDEGLTGLDALFVDEGLNFFGDVVNVDAFDCRDVE